MERRGEEPRTAARGWPMIRLQWKSSQRPAHSVTNRMRFLSRLPRSRACLPFLTDSLPTERSFLVVSELCLKLSSHTKGVTWKYKELCQMNTVIFFIILHHNLHPLPLDKLVLKACFGPLILIYFDTVYKFQSCLYYPKWYKCPQGWNVSFVFLKSFIKIANR